MKSFLWLKGRSSRLTYALIALPILLIFAGSPFIANNLHILLQKLGVTVTPVNIGDWFIPILLFIKLLIIPLMIVTIRRLHDIGLTGFLALPYLIGEGARSYAAWLRVSSLSGPDLTDPALRLTITYVSVGTYYYGLVLALVLCLIPSRKKSDSPSAVTA